jgi:CheY-like chemotaxis protein
MGGEIEVDSAPGEGSTFWLRLAWADEAPEPIPAPDAARSDYVAGTADRPAGLPLPQASPALPPLAVLCIEDNPVNLLVIEAMVTQLPGLTLRTAADGAEGLRSARAEPPALILTDIQMPGMDGFELLARLRAEPATQHVPVVAISADALPASVERGRAAGFADYLTKPVEMEALHAVLQGLVTRQPA